MKNKVQLIGHIGHAPELIDLPTGTKLLKVSLATDSTHRDAGGVFSKVTQWHPLIAWGKVAERMSSVLMKGSEVMVKGSLQHRTIEDKAGRKRRFTDVIIRDFTLLKNKIKSDKTTELKAHKLPF